MARSLQQIPSQPDLFIMIPPPLYGEYSEINETVVNERFSELIPEIAEELGLPEENVVKINEALGGPNLTEYQYFCDGQNCCDGCHPNDSGY